LLPKVWGGVFLRRGDSRAGEDLLPLVYGEFIFQVEFHDSKSG